MSPSLVEGARALLLADLLNRQAVLIVINVAVASAAATVFADQAPGHIVVAWLGAMLTVQIIRSWGLVHLRSGNLAERPAYAARLLTLLSGLSGLGWGASGVLFFEPAPGAHEAFLPFVLAGMAAGSIASLAAHPPALYSFLGASLLPYALSLGAAGVGHTGLMSVVTIGYAIGLALLGYQTHLVLRRSASLHLHNADLVADLERARGELEERVRQRTSELQRANAALSLEVERRGRTEAKVRHLLVHDPLTNLPNRILLLERLEQALARARRDGLKVAVAAFDIDLFKETNDSFGHPVGDAILCQLGQRMLQAVRASDTVGRLGGDEFAVVAPGMRNQGDPEALGRKLVEACSEPFVVDQRRLAISISVGIALFPDHGAEAGALLAGADMALYQAKAAGRGSWSVLTGQLQQRFQRERRLELELRRALDRDEFFLLYQPRFSLPEQRIVAAEALIRWRHPERGIVAPAEFIPIAEASGIICEIGEWVMDAACLAAARWNGGGDGVRVAVNLSALEFRRADLMERIRRSLERALLEPSLLELEITESAYLDRARGAVDDGLRRLAGLGVRVAIDDFGTGYSSLAYLRWLPIDTIKIDRSFTASIGHDARTSAIVTTIVALARNLDKSVVAEGIEERQQLEVLQGLGCDEAQGFLLCYPVSAEAIQTRLAGERRRAAR